MTTPEGSILVVEDMSQIRGLLEVTLRFEGYPVTSASNGEEAMKLIAEQVPAVIITDILMPRMDGFALVYNLRKNPATRNIPVVFLSATYVTKEDKEFALSLGAVRFLEKPIDTAEFLLTIGEVIAQGPPTIPLPLGEKEFYTGYRKRLENKLRQKNQQISRTQRLLETLDDSQKPAFEALLNEANEHRSQILHELEEIIQNLKKLEE